MKSIGRAAVLFLCALISLLPLQGLVNAQEAATGWLAVSDPEMQSSELPAGYQMPYSLFNYNTDCDTRDFNVIAREAKSLSTYPYRQTELRYKADCAVNTPRGMTDGTYLDAGVPAGKFTGASAPIMKIPNSKTLLSVRSVMAGALEATFYKAIVPQTDSITGEVQFNLVGSSSLTDQSGAKIYLRPNSMGFSSDGRWMVADSTIGFIRVDLGTKTVLPFATGLVYDAGFDPTPKVAISSDGRYTAISSGGNLFSIYDLSTCASVPLHITGPVSCLHKDLWSLLATKFSTFLGGFYIRFVSPDLLTFIASTRDQSGTLKRLSVRMTPNGQALENVNYLALGDSFSSGEGTYVYEQGTDSSLNKCHLSNKSYPYLTANALNIDSFHNVACSGAKTGDFSAPQLDEDKNADTWTPGNRAQETYMSLAKPSVVTLSMIGNDIGFRSKIVRCLAPDSCFHFKEDRQSIVDEINGKFNTLVNMYLDIKQQAPNAKVYVLGYPQLFSSTGSCPYSVSLDAEERQMSQGMVGYLNAVIKAATQKAGVQYIDVEHAFDGHLLCDAGQAAANGLSSGNDTLGIIGNESFHPNKLGHKLMSDQLLAQSQMLAKPMPAPDANVNVPTAQSQVYANFVAGAPSGGRLMRMAYVGVDTVTGVIKGAQVNISTGNLYAPLTPFEVWFNSDPTHAGTITTNEDGQLNGAISVPANIEPGVHTVHAYGKDLSGKGIDLYTVVYVGESDTDYDGDGIPNSNEECLAVQPANVDEDRDGIDDACDPEITEPPVDTTPPVVTGAPDKNANANGWHNSDVTIHWTATDPEPSSGAPTQPSLTVAGQEGVHTYASERSCDPFNNCAMGSLELKIDKTAPDITYTLDPSPTASGWNNGAVTVVFACSDAVSGVARCSEPQTVRGADGAYVVTGSVTDNAGNTSGVNVFVAIDSVKPAVSQTFSPAANADGWNSSDVAVTPICGDDLSGVLECSPSLALSGEGADQVVRSSATDKASNTATTQTTVNIDKTAPVLGSLVWSSNPKSTLGASLLTVAASDNLSGIKEAEYFLGDDDPGKGNGATMQIHDGAISVGFGVDFPSGVYKVTVRAKDKAGNWSASVSDYLVVYDPFGTRMTGKRMLLPSLVSGDILPGLIDGGQSDRAKFGFDVHYDNRGNISRNSDFQFVYETGMKCNRPAHASNCHSFELDATSIAWLTTEGKNDSTGTFQGAAELVVDGTRSNVTFRLTGLDGERLDTASEDRLTLKIYREGDNPNTAAPIYQVSGGVLRGNIKIRKW